MAIPTSRKAGDVGHPALDWGLGKNWDSKVAVLLLMVYHIRVNWVVDFYQEPDGSAPVEEFLESLRPEGRAKALALIQALKMHGPACPSLTHRRLREKSGNCGLNMARTKSGSSILPTPEGPSYCCTDS